MIWGLRKKSVQDLPLVLDIGTTWVKAVAFYVESNTVNVVGRGLQRQTPDSMRGGMVVDLPAVVETCQQAIDQALGGNFTCSSVILGVNGQLVEGITTTVHYDRAHPDQPLEHSEIKNIIYKVQQRAHEKLRQTLADKFLDDHPDIDLIHAAIVDVQLDGYTVENPIGFQGKRLTLTIFNAYIPLIYESILQNLAKELGLNIASIAAQPYGVSKVFVNPDAETEHKNGIFIDIGGQTTDVVVVRNGTIEGMQSFTFGGDALTFRLKQELGGSLEKAEKTKLAYANNKLDKRSGKKISEIIRAEADVWLSGVELALKEFTNTKILPSRIYLTGGSAPLPELARALMTKKWREELPFTKKPHPQMIQPDELWGVQDETGRDIQSQDIPPLALTKLTLNLVSDDDVITNTLQSIVRSMKE